MKTKNEKRRRPTYKKNSTDLADREKEERGSGKIKPEDPLLLENGLLGLKKEGGNA